MHNAAFFLAEQLILRNFLICTAHCSQNYSVDLTEFNHMINIQIYMLDPEMELPEV